MTILSAVNTIKGFLNSSSIPANVLPSLLLRVASLNRPGLSAYKIASNIIANNKQIGIPTEARKDGGENMINEFTYNVVKSVIEALKEDASVQVVIPAGTLMVQCQGGNAGGPVTCVGTNIKDSIGNGIIQ